MNHCFKKLDFEGRQRLRNVLIQTIGWNMQGITDVVVRFQTFTVFVQFSWLFTSHYKKEIFKPLFSFLWLMLSNLLTSPYQVTF